MSKKLFTVTALITLALSACNGQAAVETSVPTPTETHIVLQPSTNTPVPVVTETPTTQASLTPGTAAPTAGTPFPTNLPDCTNKASFVADITIPDKTNVGGGTAFTKIWRIGNTGTCVWTPEYIVTYYSDERMGAPDSLPLAVTYPGQTVDISLNLTAPTSKGTHQANFVIKNPAGLIMKIGDDSRLWVIIEVTTTGTTASTATTAPTTTAPTSAATAVTATVPVAVTNTSPAVTESAPSSGSATCLFSIDRTKLTETINAVNAYRTQKGLPAYIVNPKLAQAAQRQANDAACNRIYNHTGSDGSTPQTRVAATGYVASSVSENINGNNPPFDGQGVVNWWINDKGDVRHGENLLSTTFTEIGVGYSFFNDFGFYVIVFAKP